MDREAQIESIAKLGTRLNHLSTVTEIGAAICLELRQLIDYHNVRVYRVEDEDVVPVAWRGEVGTYTGEVVEQLRLRVGQGITGWVAHTASPSTCPMLPMIRGRPDTRAPKGPARVASPGTDGLRRARTIGVIVLAKLGLDRFTPDDLRYLGIYATIAAQAMANADISERLQGTGTDARPPAARARPSCCA